LLQVPRQVLDLCCRLVSKRNAHLSLAALHTAAVLLDAAAAGLPKASMPGASRSSSSSSSSNKLSSTLLQQLEQSGFLQLLPELYSNLIQQLEVSEAAAGERIQELGKAWAYQVDLFALLLSSLQKLAPDFWTKHAAAQQCLVPAMRLAVLSVRHVSRALQQSGLQEPQPESWMDALVQATTCVANTALDATLQLHCMHTVEAAAGSTESSRNPASSTLTSPDGAGGAAASSSSRSDTSAAIPEAVRAEPTLQWASMSLLLTMLQPIAQGSGACAVNSTDSGGSSRVSSQTADSSSHARPRHKRHQQRQQQASIGPLSDNETPGVVRPTLPAAYSTVLDQLGCSGQLAMWLAKRMDMSQQDIAVRNALVVCGFSQARMKLAAPDAHSISLYLSLPAVLLQCLCDLPPATLPMQTGSCMKACVMAGTLLQDNLRRAGMQQQQQEQQQVEQPLHTGENVSMPPTVVAAVTAATSLGALFLHKMLGQWRILAGMAGGTTTASASSRSSSSSTGVPRSSSGPSSSTNHSNVSSMMTSRLAGVKQVCRHAALLVTYAAAVLLVAGDSTDSNRLFAPDVVADPNSVTPCSVLQEFVRLSAADTQHQHSSVDLSWCRAFLDHSLDNCYDALVAPVVAGERMDSFAALHLYGLLCGMLKFSMSVGCSSNVLLQRTSGGQVPLGLTWTAVVFYATSSVLALLEVPGRAQQADSLTDAADPPAAAAASAPQPTSSCAAVAGVVGALLHSICCLHAWQHSAGCTAWGTTTTRCWASSGTTSRHFCTALSQRWWGSTTGSSCQHQLRCHPSLSAEHCCPSRTAVCRCAVAGSRGHEPAAGCHGL
jgi:hypothetical protein